MLRELVALEPRKPIFREYEEGLVGESEIRVKVEFGAPKHGSEMQAFQGVDPFLSSRFDNEYQLFIEDEEVKREPYFLALGNMCVGRVTELGKNVNHLEEGQRVAF